MIDGLADVPCLDKANVRYLSLHLKEALSRFMDELDSYPQRSVLEAWFQNHLRYIPNTSLYHPAWLAPDDDNTMNFAVKIEDRYVISFMITLPRSEIDYLKMTRDIVGEYS